jgi:hypothetical protein
VVDFLDGTQPFPAPPITLLMYRPLCFLLSLRFDDRLLAELVYLLEDWPAEVEA